MAAMIVKKMAPEHQSAALFISLNFAAMDAIRRRRHGLSPTAMQPKPLFGVLADPPFDHVGNRLHRTGNVDAAVGVACRRDRFSNLAPKRIAIGKANDAQAVNRTSSLPRQKCDQRIGEASTAKKIHLDALGEVLVGEHTDMAASLQEARKLDRRR